jgi:crossover junction endodeoxyribonuclease RuvC
VRVLGIDPGSRYLGYGLVDAHPQHPGYVQSGVVNADTGGELSTRLHIIATSLRQIINVYKPQVVAVEGVFTHKNARSALILGHARGVALLLAAEANLPVFEYAPARVKRSVGAGGNDSKASVARMVEIQLKLPEALDRADAYDALAVALCHVHQTRGLLMAGQVVNLKPRKGQSAHADFLSRLKPSVVKARKHS